MIQTINLFSMTVKNLDPVYVLPDDFHDFLEKPLTGYFSVLHFNIRSIKIFFESLYVLNFICFSETWCGDSFIYDLSNYASTHQKRSNHKSWGVSVYIYSSLNFKTKLDFSINCGGIESLALEIISEKTRNIIVHVSYRLPNGHFKYFENLLRNLFLKHKMFLLQEISVLTYWIIASIKKCRTI